MNLPFADDVPRMASATIDPTGLYRYDLRRDWDSRLGLVNFIMLNPSTADGEEDDPTIRRCKGFASSWGYGQLVVTNLFAYRSTDPEALRLAVDPVGPENDLFIVRWATAADLVIAAWGTKGLVLDRGRKVLSILASAGVEVSAIKLTSGNYPSHPLYLASRLRPFVFRAKGVNP